MANRPREYYEGERLFHTKKKLCRFVSQDEDLMTRWSKRPLVMLAFDESQFLTDLPRGHTSRYSSLFTNIDDVLSTPLPIFSLFISKAGRFHEPTPKAKLHSSVLLYMRPQPLCPFTAVGYDHLAFPALENTVTLERVVQTDWIAHLGRPVYIRFTSYLGEPLTSLFEQVWCLL